MEMLTKRLKLIPCSEELVRNDEVTGEHISHYLQSVSIDPSMEGWGVWLVYLQPEGRFIGDIGFKGKPHKGVVEVGYGIRKEAQNHGYATEAVDALINWAFQTGLVKKVKAECLKDNEASIKVLKKVMMNITDEDEQMMYWERKLEK
ncbi:GNAT family N-acetyltransferase [Metabacillus litoralis]|uniref:GNAT family N-acetyltransferase n=1 Tax=Metabacillus litoralis TaxID=152268 RepID=A0A5C6W0F8_9BACI|nr:GNAT family N-acetyltransferase [Metabacillus litoralis]TXC91143.1 GNAT family N-acetyltransferase [Metabacillus litoralis]